MATRTAKLRVEVDGEKEYKQAISELNKGNQVLASEMRKLSAEYKGNEKSIEALNAKSDLLQRQLQQQKDKVATLREALANAAKQYGEADRRTQEWQIKLNDAEAAQAKLEHQIDETNEEIKQQGDAVDKESGKMVSLGDAVDQVAGKLGIKIPDGAKKALAGMDSFSAGTVAKMGAVAAAVAAVVKVMQSLNDLTLEAASRADDLMTQSITSGISTDLLQAYQYAAPYIDVSADTIVAANKKIGLSIANAAEQFASYNEAAAKAAAQGKEYEGNLGAQAEAFQRLGVSVTDMNGQLRDSQTVMTEVNTALNGVGNGTERNALANAIYGKSFDELAPLIQDQEKFQRLLNEAMESGYVLTQQQLEILGEVDDAHNKYTQTIEKNKDLIATQWAPASKEAYEALASLMDKAGKALIDSGLVSNFAALVQSTIGLFESASTLFDAMPSWLNPLKLLSGQLQILAMTLAAVADYVDAVSSLLRLDFKGVGDALGFGYSSGRANNVQRARMASQGTLSMYDEFYAGRNAAGTSDWRGGLTWVGEAGPELVALPRGSQIYNAQDSRNMGGQVININVQGIQQLDEVVGWYESRRVRERMR